MGKVLLNKETQREREVSFPKFFSEGSSWQKLFIKGTLGKLNTFAAINCLTGSHICYHMHGLPISNLLIKLPAGPDSP